VSLLKELAAVRSIFIDTAPIIYYIEAHPKYGVLAKSVVDLFRGGKLSAFSSVITLTEVLAKPIEAKDKALATEFAEFLKYGKNLTLIEISEGIAERAGILRGRNPSLKALDAIQIASAIDVGADAFLTNDGRLAKIKEIKVLILNDFA
jgi:predicted nucleic acid-binding protein